MWSSDDETSSLPDAAVDSSALSISDCDVRLSRIRISRSMLSSNDECSMPDAAVDRSALSISDCAVRFAKYAQEFCGTVDAVVAKTTKKWNGGKSKHRSAKKSATATLSIPTSTTSKRARGKAAGSQSRAISTSSGSGVRRLRG